MRNRCFFNDKCKDRLQEIVASFVRLDKDYVETRITLDPRGVCK